MNEIVIGNDIYVSDRGVAIFIPFDVDTRTFSEDEIEQLTNALNTRWAEKHSVRTTEDDPELEEIQYDEERTPLYDADPFCKHVIVTKWDGYKCEKCPGWYCA